MNKKVLLLSCVLIQASFAVDDVSFVRALSCDGSGVELVRTIKLPVGPTYNFTLFADGRLAVFFEKLSCLKQVEDKELFVFDWIRNKEILSANKIFVKKIEDLQNNDFAFSADGKVAAIFYARSNCLIVFNVETNQPISTLRFDEFNLPRRCVALSQDGKNVAIACSDYRYAVRASRQDCFAIYNFETGQIVKRYEHQSIKQVALSPKSSNLIVKVFDNNQISVCDIETNREVLSLERIKDIQDIKFSGCGQFIIITCLHKRRTFFEIVRIADGKVIFNIEGWGPCTVSPCCNCVVRQSNFWGEEIIFDFIDSKVDCLRGKIKIDYDGTFGILKSSIQFSPCGNFLIIQVGNTVRIFKKHGHPLPPEYVPDAPRHGAGVGGGADGGCGGPAAAAGTH